MRMLAVLLVGCVMAGCASPTPLRGQDYRPVWQDRLECEKLGQDAATAPAPPAPVATALGVAGAIASIALAIATAPFGGIGGAVAGGVSGVGGGPKYDGDRFRAVYAECMTGRGYAVR